MIIDQSENSKEMTPKSKKLNIDYTGVFHNKLGEEGLEFEHELV